jgi:hypothetical protein
MESWRADGPVRHWAMCDAASGRIAGGVELRDLGGGEVNLSYVVFPSSDAWGWRLGQPGWRCATQPRSWAQRPRS